MKTYCVVCYSFECQCRFIDPSAIIHKSKYCYRSDPVRLPYRSVYCTDKAEYSKTHAYWTKVNCPKCLKMKGQKIMPEKQTIQNEFQLSLPLKY